MKLSWVKYFPIRETVSADLPQRRRDVCLPLGDVSLLRIRDARGVALYVAVSCGVFLALGLIGASMSWGG